MNKIVVIVGPTASGKTKVSVEVAKYLNAEIINADAVQIYKDVNIGSAKTTKEEMCGIIHHMIDFNPLENKYTIYDYQKDARKILDKLIEENKNVVIVGGSGLYIKALLYDYNLIPEVKKDYELEKYSNEELKKLADEYYPYNEIHVNNRKRLERFIKHYNNTNLIIENTPNKDKPLYEFKIIGLEVDREELYERINLRVDKMMDLGLLEEAKKLFDQNKNTDSIIGYRELNKYFRNELSLDETIDLIKKDSRHYAKRQYTWFKNQFQNIYWIKVNYNSIEETLSKVIEEIKK